MTNGAEGEPLLVPAPVAQHKLGIGRTKFFELLASGELESVKIGRRRLVPLDALKAYTQQLRGVPTRLS